MTNTLGPGFQSRGFMDIKRGNAVGMAYIPRIWWPPFYLTFIQNLQE